MKHTKYSICRALYHNPDIKYLKQFFEANIRTLYFYPSSIWYSLRLNFGEKFMLFNPNIYPFTYGGVSGDQVEKTPVNQATKLSSNLTEFEIVTYLLKNRTENYILKRLSRDINVIKSETESTYEELVKILNLVEENNIDMPVFVYSQVMNGYNIGCKYKINQSINIIDSNKLINKFLGKIEYSSGEGIVNAMGYLVNTGNWDHNIWNQLISALNTKEFMPEFTKVCNRSPFLFRYREVDEKEMKNNLLDENANQMFLLGNIYKIID
jgi:hypothetical protein